jgi:low temperature requirement protein LtrA
MSTEARAEESAVVPVTPAEEEKRTEFIELFFDLVFVFAFTQVTTLALEDTSAAGFARAALVFALIWWAWSAYAWLTDAIDVENIPTRLFIFAAMLASFFMALAVPNAFTDEARWFVLSYFVVRVLQIVLYVWGVRHDPAQRVAVGRLAPAFLVAPTIALAGGLVDDPWRTTLWVVSLSIDVAGTLFAARASDGEFRVAPAHFAERYALIVIIALGESIVAIGLAAEGLPEDRVYAFAVAVAFAGAAAAWWAYFDWVQIAAEHALERADRATRGPLARDVYTYFHYPIVLGIVFLAVAAKKTLTAPSDPLPDGGRAALALGLVLFLLGFVLIRLRAIRRIAWERIGAALAVVLLVLLLDDADAVVLSTLSVAALAAALAVEAIRLREARARFREAAHPTPGD